MWQLEQLLCFPIKYPISCKQHPYLTKCTMQQSEKFSHFYLLYLRVPHSLPTALPACNAVISIMFKSNTGPSSKCLTGNGEKLTYSPAVDCNWLCLAGVYFPSFSGVLSLTDPVVWGRYVLGLPTLDKVRRQLQVGVFLGPIHSHSLACVSFWSSTNHDENNIYGENYDREGTENVVWRSDISRRRGRREREMAFGILG